MIICSKVSALLREDHKLNKVSLTKVERKSSKRDDKSGVVIVTCKSKNDVNSVMSSKRNLKSSRQYSNVYIHRDQTLQQRIEKKNFQTIVGVLKSVDPNIDMKGAEIIAKRYVSYQDISRYQGSTSTRDSGRTYRDQGNNRGYQHDRGYYTM